MKIKVIDSYQNYAEYEVSAGESVYAALLENGLELDSPCHGNGSCHKCRILADGKPALACGLEVKEGMTVEIPYLQGVRIRTS